MGEDMSFTGLLVVAVIAVAAPLVVSAVRRPAIPNVVVEIVAGIVVGPVLGWVEPDRTIDVVALLGLAFMLFLAGLEIDVTKLRGDLARLPLVGFGVTLALGLVAGVGFHAVGWVRDPLFLAIALAATSLGLVVPVLKDAGQTERPLGQLVIAGATVADFGAVILLSLLFSESEGGIASRLVTFGLFAGVAGAVALAVVRAGRSVRLDAVFVRLQDTTAEIRVRVAVALLVGFVALAGEIGLETILGAFLAGAVVSLADRDMATHPHFRLKLEALGYGFLVPVFFVASGLRFDLDALTGSPAALARVPLFLLALLVVRGVPALLYRRAVGDRGVVPAALLQATSLPFIVTAAEIGVAVDAVAPVTAAALVTAGLLSVVLFPALAVSRLAAMTTDSPAGAVPGERR
jgi:Kef-type K+ transport system membrane component KefB